MIAEITAFYAAHRLLCHVILFVILFLIDDNLPEELSQYKIITKCIKKIGQLLTEEQIEKINEKLETNHEIYMGRISDVEEKIKTVDINRQEDCLATLRDRITQMYHYHQKKGYILEDDKKDFNALFTRYTINGGNSYVQEDIAPFMKSLPRFMSDGDAERFFNEHGNYNNGTEDK